MKIEVNEQSDIVLKDVYNSIILETNSGESIGICMRDSGFEFNYQGKDYSAQDGVIKLMDSQKPVKEDYMKGVGQIEYQQELNKYYQALEDYVDGIFVKPKQCIAEGCSKVVDKNNVLCNVHYSQLEENFIFELDEAGQMHTPEMICSREGCDNAATQFGLCPDHFEEL